ncbi:phosphotransferase enzyme family protein [Niabella aquatica]
MDITDSVLGRYGFEGNDYTIKKFGSGLINNTWLVLKGSEKYILQKVNNKIFTNPCLIADNIEKIQAHLSLYSSHYFFTTPCKTIKGQSMVQLSGNYYRMFPYVNGSHTIDVVQSPQQAYEAASQFSKFTSVLSGLDINTLHITLPSFHDLSLRYKLFLDALEKGNQERRRETTNLTEELKAHSAIVDTYNHIKNNPAFKLRVTHHDTKISNVLFDDDYKGICVIDLDTVMPGYFISDVGDMMRTYLCPVSEEEKDFGKIEVRDEFYFAIVNGYKAFMNDQLTATEKQYFFYSGAFMIYMQAIRFLTDYINDDVYYGSRYPKHNLVRATNQSVLLRRLMEKEKQLSVS